MNERHSQGFNLSSALPQVTNVHNCAKTVVKSAMTVVKSAITVVKSSITGVKIAIKSGVKQRNSLLLIDHRTHTITTAPG